MSYYRQKYTLQKQIIRAGKMSKRRRTSSIASRQEDDSLDSLEASTSSGPTMRKRPKRLDPMELCHQLYDSIRNHKKEDGTLLCDPFIRVPKRRQEPGYHDVVSNPIDLIKVQQKLKTEEYEDMDDLQSDIELIVSNSKAFYKRNSQEYKDASELWDLFLANKHRILLTGKEEEPEPKSKFGARVGRPRKAGTPVECKHDADHSEDTSESSTNPDDETNLYEELFAAVMTATDCENKPLHASFQLLPSKRKYPEYYEVIETPIDLKMIATKIQNNDYLSLGEIEKDFLLMTRNACLFNEPGSQIYKNAKALKKLVQSRKIELEHQTRNSGKSSERIRNKRLRGSTSLSAVTAALRDDESDIEMDAEDQTDEEPSSEPMDVENPQWQLLEAVKAPTNSSGVSLSEPFWRLPSRRFYADYYREIKNPVSLTQIRRKLLKRAYGTVSEVAGDMTVMFENAKKYNQPTSKLYKDAVKLQKIMQAKVQELLDIDQDTDGEFDVDLLLKKRPGLKTKSAVLTPQRGRPPRDPIPMKKRLHALAKYMLDYVCEDGRKPMLGFMEKPSKKLYPEYYEVIQEPIDFLEIESKIRADQYSCENDLVKDFKLMFSNCRQFNEENSPIYEDSLLLEKHLIDRVGHSTTPEKKDKSVVRIVKPRKHLSPIEKNLKRLYETIRDYREPKANRQLAQIFMKLPSKIDYPDYYEVIRNPIDMERIAHKLKSFSYDNLEELVADFVNMFDNACKYNEPDSQIYKDALVLQRVCLQTKLQLKEDDDTVPDVPAAIQDILLNLFTMVYNHQDAEERCFTDSLAELPEHDDVDGKKVRAVSLDLIKRRLDRGLYKRLDTFQDDFFACLDRARRLSRSDSQLFADSIELQSYFIKQRDELCKCGELLMSPALTFTPMDLTASVESLRQSKLLEESLEEENETRSSDDSMNVGESMICNQQMFKVGEFVYLDAKEKGVDPHILLIERLWTNNGQQMLYGNYYLRPAETFHLTTRKFLEKEVFKSDTHIAVPLEEVKERCCVLNIKQYFAMKAEGYDDKDVYVCESRYSTRNRNFKKIKLFPENPSLKLVQREVPLEPKRIVSVFRERIEKHKDELAELQEQEKLVDKDKPNVVAYTSIEVDDGNTYYEQYNTICSGVVKTGDFVYVAADGGRQLIAQVDSIWDTKDGKGYFRGPWFVAPAEVPQPPPNRIFLKQEVFLSSMEDTNPLVGIMGKCSVLDFSDYISCRPTELPEADVFICNSMYDELNKQVCKLPPEGIKKYVHSNLVTEDEIYYFPKLLNPPKVGIDVNQVEPEVVKSQTVPIHMEAESSPHLTKMNDMDIMMDDSLDGGPPSVGSGEIPVTVATPGITPSTPATSKKNKNKNKVVTGYILYSREVRKQVVQNNPESNFGEISRIVGNEWRSLPTGEKQAWEERASKLNEEAKAMLLLDESCLSPAPPNPDQAYECLWDGCDFQFEELQDCLEHCIKDSKDSQGHVQAFFQSNSESELHCQWRNCIRNNKKNIQPFPNLARLVRHVRDMHINKGNGRLIPQDSRSKNFKSSSKPAAVSRPTPTATPNPPANSTFSSTAGTLSTATNSSASNSSSTSAQVQKQEPLFITVPPRPQRVLHSEAYIKYIEGLQADNKYISPWEKTLYATQETSVSTPDAEKLQNVTVWLGKKVDQHDNVVAALWHLRNKLLRDSLGLQKTL